MDSGVSPAAVQSLAASFPGIPIMDVSKIVGVLMGSAAEPLPPSAFCPDVGLEDERIVIFTSGTTGNPKGVRLPYRAYECNQKTFESFLLFNDQQEDDPS